MPSLRASLRSLACLALAAAGLPLRAQTAPLRVAIVGLVHGHVQGFLQQLPQHKDVQLVGLSDPSQELRARYQKQTGMDAKAFFPDEASMLRAVHPDAVLVYTSIVDHRQAIETAAAQHISSMVEKPLATTMDDALAIRKIAHDQHVHVLVNYETTWYASNTAAYHELTDGHLGPMRKLVVRDGHRGPKEIGVGPEFLSWLTDPVKNGAGSLFDFGCYGADLSTWLMHGETPLTVTAVTQQIKPEEYPKVDDQATVILTYPHAQAILQPSWNWPFDIKDMQVYGATGYIKTIKADNIELRLAGDKEATTKAAPPLSAPEDNSLDYLAAVLRGQITPKGDLTALDTNIIVMQILTAARDSARTGTTIKLQPIAPLQ